MSQELAKQSMPEISVIEQVVMQGDLSKLDPQQRVTYYNNVCKSVGLNPFTQPFAYIQLNGKLTLYAKKDATEQLRKLNGISIEKLESQMIDDLYIVKATAKTKDGRTDESTGAVTLGHLKGDARANAIMKAETKAKRRVTLSISGMGWVDESEVDTIPGANCVDIDMNTGEIKNIENKSNDVLKNTSPKPEIISEEKANELYLLLLQCTPEFQKDILAFCKKGKVNENLIGLPLALSERLHKSILKNIEDQKQKEEVLENLEDE